MELRCPRISLCLLPILMAADLPLAKEAAAEKSSALERRQETPAVATPLEPEIERGFSAEEEIGRASCRERV